ncbi:hypothetical protein RHO15_09605 [Utexia brackfieldae]|uniref:phage tail termination protein n=1 Tax=Utexia brackfieldae TaxID=3074108 RepID=UPI00370D7E30
MYKLVRDYLDKSGLLNSLVIQYLRWDDDGNNKIYVVFSPNGGSTLSASLGNEYLVLVNFIAPNNNAQLIDDLVDKVTEYIKKNQFDETLGSVQIVGGIPSPTSLTDNRLVYRLLLAIKHGT